MAHIDLNVRMLFVQTLYAFRSCDHAHELDLLAAMLLDELDGVNGGTAGGQHRVGDHDGSELDGRGELAVVFHRLVGLRIAVESDMTYLGGGNQHQDAVGHAETCAEDRYYRQLLACNHRSLALLDGGLHFDIFQRKVPERLIAHENGDLFGQLAEFVGTGILISEN